MQGDKSTISEKIAIEPKNKPKRRPIVGMLQVVVIIILMVLAFVYSREPNNQSDATPSQKITSVDSKPIPLVSVIKPTASAQQVIVTSTGSVAVQSYVTLVSQVSGRVIEASPELRSGGRFVAGEKLLMLEKKDFTLALAQAQADVTSAQASLQLSEAESSAAISNYLIISPGKKVPPLVAKAPQVAQAKAQLQSAIARRDIAQVNLERSVFSLPFSGRVVESSAGEGQLLNANQSFGRVYALDSVEVVISLSPQELAKIKPAQNRIARVTADDISFDGRIERVAAERDNRTRLSQVFLSADNSQSLIPGTFVSVALKGPMIDDVYMVPENAMQIGQVFWIVENGVITEIPATVLDYNNGEYMVKAFDYGEGIIIGSVPGAKNGLSVRLSETN
jgi:RND family efflux transporter MFP subunit